MNCQVGYASDNMKGTIVYTVHQQPLTTRIDNHITMIHLYNPLKFSDINV